MKKTFLLVASVIFLLAFNSCSKDDESSAPFSGTWTAPDSTGRLVLTLTDNSFETMFQYGVGGGFFDMEGIKGSLTYNDSIINLVVASFGYASYNSETQKFDNFTWYNKGHSEFSKNISDWGGAYMEIGYEVSGDKLTIKFDDNEDGVYQSDEIEIYTRQ